MTDGERQVPLHLIEYIDSKLAHHTTRVEQIFADHVTDEMQRFGEIQGSVKTLTALIESNHRATMAQAMEHAARAEELESAFLRTENGTLDFRGHHGYHTMREATQRWWDTQRNSILGRLLEWAVVAFAGWLLYTLWKTLLAGPG